MSIKWMLWNWSNITGHNKIIGLKFKFSKIKYSKIKMIFSSIHKLWSIHNIFKIICSNLTSSKKIIMGWPLIPKTPHKSKTMISFFHSFTLSSKITSVKFWKHKISHSWISKRNSLILNHKRNPSSDLLNHLLSKLYIRWLLLLEGLYLKTYSTLH